MGLIITSNGRELWEPSQDVGRLFVDQIHTLVGIAGAESGVSRVVSDEVEIDGPRFCWFVNQLAKRLGETDHSVLLALASGPFQVAAALHFRLCGDWPKVSPRLYSLLEGARGLGLPCARTGEVPTFAVTTSGARHAEISPSPQSLPPGYRLYDFEE